MAATYAQFQNSVIITTDCLLTFEQKNEKK